MNLLTFLNREIAVTLIDYPYHPYLPQSTKKVNGGVLIERTHYYTILVEGFRTIREGLLIEEGALTEVVRYISIEMCYFCLKIDMLRI